MTIFGAPQFYLPSTGFPGAPPDLVRSGMPRQLNELAAQLPAGTIVIRFMPDESDPQVLQGLSIQPVA